jgi:predicted nucleic acid-binding protein
VSFLLDTNVVSELHKREPDHAVTSWFASVRAIDLHLSVLVVGEIRNGIQRLARRDRDRATGYEKWLADLLDLYGDRVVPVTVEVAETWGLLNVPDPLPVIDGLLAATALVHDWTLVTRNTADMRRTGVRLLDPFAWSRRR